jgi:hypothetical protein
MANAKIKNRHCVNLKTNKHCYITITSADNDFTLSTSVVAVQDIGNGLEWGARVVKQKAGELRVRLTARARAVGKGNKVKAPPPPDSGDLTVTLSPPKTVDPATVDYVEDNHP